MSNINWDEIIQDAASETEAQYSSKISRLSRLNAEEVEEIIKEGGISQKDLAMVLKEVMDAAKSNEEKAKAISNISGGLQTVVSIISKVL